MYNVGTPLLLMCINKVNSSALEKGAGIINKTPQEVLGRTKKKAMQQ